MQNRREPLQSSANDRKSNGISTGKISDYLIEESGQLLPLLEDHPNHEWISWTTLTEEIDPLACIEASQEEPDLHYWERPDETLAIAAGGCVTRLQATGSDRFRRIAEQALELGKQHLAITDIPHTLSEPILLGGYSFSDHNVEREWKQFGAARFTLPQWTLFRSGKLHLLTLSTARNGRSAEEVGKELYQLADAFQTLCNRIRESGTEPRPAKRTTSPTGGQTTLTLTPQGTYKEWVRQVETSREMIRRGTFQKIVLARQVDATAPNPINIPGALYHFRHRFPSCFNFMMRTGGGPVFMGASPERLVSLNSRRILTDGLAGSTARGESAVEDLTLGRQLMASEKERSEHNFVVEDIRNSLQNWSRRVRHPDTPLLKKLNNVQHLYTPITAEVERDISIHQLIESLHPTPAVGGFPKEQAVRHITSIEGVDRGWYAGPVGWFNLSGNGEFAVAIRSALVNGSHARLYAGSGIVRDSDPEREWQETIIKLRPMLDAIKPAGQDG